MTSVSSCCLASSAPFSGLSAAAELPVWWSGGRTRPTVDGPRPAGYQQPPWPPCVAGFCSAAGVIRHDLCYLNAIPPVKTTYYRAQPKLPDPRAGRRGPLPAGLVGVLVAAALGAYVQYRTVWDSIKRVDVISLGKQPPKFNNAENILLLGSDPRTGGNGRIGGHVGCNCSDTVMLLHISQI